MAGNTAPCKYFNTPSGCRNGANCTFAHAFSVKPPCRFFGSEVGCRFGDSCMYSHDGESKVNRGSPPRRMRGRGRGRYQSRGMMAAGPQQERQWYQDESDEENSPPKSKTGSRLNDMLSHGLKPTPEGWQEYAAIQRAFKEYDEDVEMTDGTVFGEGTLNELLSFGLKPTHDGWDEYWRIKNAFEEHARELGESPSSTGKGRGRGAMQTFDDFSTNTAGRSDVPFHNRGRGGRRPRGRF